MWEIFYFLIFILKIYVVVVLCSVISLYQESIQQEFIFNFSCIYKTLFFSINFSMRVVFPNECISRPNSFVRMSYGSITSCQTAFRKRHHNGEGVGMDVFAYRRCRTTPPALFSFFLNPTEGAHGYGTCVSLGSPDI